MIFLHCHARRYVHPKQKSFNVPFARGEYAKIGSVDVGLRGFGVRAMAIAWQCSSKLLRAVRGASDGVCTQHDSHSFGTQRTHVSAERPLCDISYTCTDAAPVKGFCPLPCVCVAYEPLFYAQASV